MAGRRPKPTALKILEGNPGKRPLNACEPKPTGIPTCPKHLDEEAKKEWKRISKELTSLGLLTSVDRAALAGYCVAYSRWVAAEESIQKHGLVVKAPSGYPIQNPFVSVANTALEHIRKFGIEFGFTPSSRTRLSVEPQNTSKKADEFAISRPRNFVRPTSYERRDISVQESEAILFPLPERPN